MTGWSSRPARPRQAWRNYTVRRHDPGAAEIDVDVVLHEPRGPACTGAAGAPLGAPTSAMPARASTTRRATSADWLLLCGDETAVPAIAAILETPPPVERVLAVVEVPDPRRSSSSASRTAPRLRWVHRNGHRAATSSHLADALRALELPDGRGQVWGAAESRVARDMRTVLRGERCMPRKHVKATGYWRRDGRDCPRARRGVGAVRAAGTTIGVAGRRGTATTWQGSPKTRLDQLRVDDLGAGRPRRRSRRRASRSGGSRSGHAWLRSCSTATSVRPCRVQLGAQVEHLHLVGDVEERRGLVEQQQRRLLGERHRQPDALALAARQLVDEAGRTGRPSVSRAAPRGPRARPRATTAAAAVWCGYRPRATRSATVIPSGAVELCGSRPSRRATCLEGSERITAPSSSTVPGARLEHPHERPQQRRLAAGVRVRRSR